MIRFSSLGRSLKRGLAIAAGLLVIPLTAAQLPSVYSNTSDSENLTYSSIPAPLDTTYDDGTFVILKTAACMGGVCYVDPPYPSQFTLRWKPDYSAILLFTYETGIGTALDSIAVDSVWADWGYSDPQAYAINVPGDPSDLALLGITPAESTAIADIIGYPYRADIGVSNMTWGTRFDSIFDFWYGLWRWADWTADSVLADSAGTISGRPAAQWTSLYSAVDSLCSSLFVEGHTYYDRALNHYSKWWRTGDTTWLKRGDSYYRHLRDCYWAPNTNIQPYRQFPEGTAVHYTITDDTVDLRVAQQAARFDYEGFVLDDHTGWWTNDNWGDARTQGRVVLGIFIPYYLDYDTTGTGYNWSVWLAEGLDSLLFFSDTAQTVSGVSGKWALSTYAFSHVGWQVNHTALYTLMRYVDLVIKADTGAVYDSTLAWAQRTAQYFRDSVYVGQEPPGYEIPYGGTRPGGDHNVYYMAGIDTTIVDPLRVYNHHDADSMVVWVRRWRSTTKFAWGGGPDTFPQDMPDTAAYRVAWDNHYTHKNDSLSVYDGGDFEDQAVHYHAYPAEHTQISSHVGIVRGIGVQQSGMNLTLFAWLFKETGDSTYWTMADTLIQGIWYAQEDANGDAWYYTPKLDNENYFQSQRSIYWLNNPD